MHIMYIGVPIFIFIIIIIIARNIELMLGKFVKITNRQYY